MYMHHRISLSTNLNYHNPIDCQLQQYEFIYLLFIKLSIFERIFFLLKSIHVIQSHAMTYGTFQMIKLRYMYYI